MVHARIIAVASLLLLGCGSAGAFSATIRPAMAARTPRTLVTPSRVHHLRGGTTTAVAAALVGPYAIPAATGIAAVAGSLAYIHQAYIFSLSYGLAMAAIGGAILLSSPALVAPLLRAHAGLVAAYGVRLFAFLFWRQKLQPGYDGTARLKALDKTPPLQRTPIILSTAFFYSLLSAPLLFHAQTAPFAGAAAVVSTLGAGLAGFGLVYEAVADQQKSFFKMSRRASGQPDELYTGGLFARSRHANYLGELLFWWGSFIAGAPALLAPGVPLLTRALHAAAAGLGLAGITFIMLSATRRLESRQAEKYRPSAAYDRYYRSSNALLPRLLG